MKPLTLSRFFTSLSLLYVLLSMPLHAEEKVMDLDQLEVRNHLRYVAEQTQPFSGNAVSYFIDGMQKLQVSFKDGLKHGKEIAWYEDGQLRYVVRYLNGEPQSVGSTWYARTSQLNVAAATLRFCDEEEMKVGFCDPGLQESSLIEFTPSQESDQETSRIEFTPSEKTSRIEFTP